MGRGISIRQICYCILASMIIVFLLHYALLCENPSKAIMVPREKIKYVYDRTQKAIPYDANMPLIFIGGMPRSGTTLLRALLDAHPDIRCGEETRVIPRILGMRGQWEKSSVEKNRLNEAGITTDVIDSAVKAFILEIIAKHGEAANRLCNKDPFTLKSSVYLSKLFPNSKFMLLIRDGRATVHSIIQRKVTITGFNLDSFRDCMAKWNQAMETMYGQCIHVGPHTCMPVYYEQLVLHPHIWMKRILHFLNIPWNETVLHHEDFIEKPGGISLSKTERSSDQIIKPINTEALTKWVGHIPEDVKQDMGKVAPMLQVLGYDPYAYPPNYGDPDPSIADNTMHVKQNVDFWKKKVDKMLQRSSNDKQKDTNFQPPER